MKECQRDGCSNPPRQKYCSKNCRKIAYRHRKLEEGRCYHCSEPAEPLSSYCAYHKAKERERTRRRNERRRERGECTRCGSKKCKAQGGCNYKHDRH